MTLEDLDPIGALTLYLVAHDLAQGIEPDDGHLVELARQGFVVIYTMSSGRWRSYQATAAGLRLLGLNPELRPIAT